MNIGVLSSTLSSPGSLTLTRLFKSQNILHHVGVAWILVSVGCSVGE